MWSGTNVWSAFSAFSNYSIRYKFYSTSLWVSEASISYEKKILNVPMKKLKKYKS